MDPLSGLRTVVGDPETGWEAAGEQPRPDPLGGGRGEPDLFAASAGRRGAGGGSSTRAR